MTTDQLMHYGVLGMKWGVRKDRANGKADRQTRRAEKKAARASRKDARRDFKQHRKAKPYSTRKKESKVQVTKKIADKASKDDNYLKEFDKRYTKMEKEHTRYKNAERSRKVKAYVEAGLTVASAILAYKQAQKISKLPPSKSPKLLEAQNVLDMVLGDDGIYRLK